MNLQFQLVVLDNFSHKLKPSCVYFIYRKSLFPMLRKVIWCSQIDFNLTQKLNMQFISQICYYNNVLRKYL